MVVWGCNASVTEEDLKLYEAIRDVSKWNPKMRQPLEGIYLVLFKKELGLIYH